MPDIYSGIDWLNKLSIGLGGSVGLGVLKVARFVFDAGDAAMRTIAAHGVGVTIPANAIVVGGFYDVNTGFTSASTNTGQIAIMVEAANDVVTSTAVSNAIYGTIGRKAILPKANTPENSVCMKASVAREITCTVTVAALTAGKLTGYLYFVEGLASA